MSKDVVSTVALLASFGIWGAAHLMLSWSLVRSPPRWRGPVAFVVMPLAPYWGARAGSRLLAAVWVVALTLWIASRAFLAR